MKKFMAVFTGTQSSSNYAKWQALDPAKRKELEKAGMEAWMKWGTVHAKDIVEQGGPLGKTKRVTSDGIADTRNNLSGFTIVQAESQEAAAKMFENHPQFTIFPGEAVEIMEVMPIPTM